MLRSDRYRCCKRVVESSARNVNSRAPLVINSAAWQSSRSLSFSEEMFFRMSVLFLRFYGARAVGTIRVKKREGMGVKYSSNVISESDWSRQSKIAIGWAAFR